MHDIQRPVMASQILVDHHTALDYLNWQEHPGPSTLVHQQSPFYNISYLVPLPGTSGKNALIEDCLCICLCAS